MDEGLTSDAALQCISTDTYSALQIVLQPAPRPRRRGIGQLFLLALFGSAMFTLGGAFAFYGNGGSLPIVAWQTPENFDRSSIKHRQAEERALSQAPVAPPHAAPPDAAAISSSSESIFVPQEGVSLSSESESSSVLPEGAEALTFPNDPTLPEVAVPQDVTIPMIPIAESGSESSPVESKIVSESVPAILSGSELPQPSLPEVPTSVSGPLSPQEIGVFFTQTSVKNDRFFLQTLERLRALPGSALVFNVKAGTVHFAAAAPMAEELDLIRPSYDLPDVIRKARERGVRTIGRFVALKDPNLAQAMPETQIRNPKTKRSVGDVWVDGANEKVLLHNEQILRALVIAGIDEINLDYIRYPTEYSKASIGLTGNEKADHIEAFLKMARRVIDENGGTTKLGISTYAILGWNFPVNFEYVGQDIARFAPMVDVISPMAYPATFAQGAYYNPAKNPGSRMYYLVYRTLMGYRDLLGEQAWKLRPWIQGYGITQKNLKDQIQAVFDSGSCGFTIWNAGNEYDMFMKMLPEVRRPASCGM